MTTSPLDRLSLRERKKLKTRRAIQEHALRLFAARGYDATTVEQIADAAEVSPSTFFRYFPTKEDVVLTDEYDDIIVEVFRSQPAELGPLQAIRESIQSIMRDIYEADRERLLARTRLLLSVPALRARMWDTQYTQTREMIVTLVAERLDLPPEDFNVQAFSWALSGVLQAVMMAWVDSDGTLDLPTLLDEGLDLFQSGFNIT